MGFSCRDDFEKKERQAPLINVSGERGEKRGMDLRRHGVESETEFWPIEHPMEPPDEDRPLKCPMPDSSVINNGGMREKRFAESLRKRAEVSAPAVLGKEELVEAAAEPPIRVVRKRHHTLTHGDHTIAPLMRMPPLPALQTHNITIFQMLQQFDKF